MSGSVVCSIIFCSENENEIQKMHDDFNRIYRTNRDSSSTVRLDFFAKEYLPHLTERQIEVLKHQGYFYSISPIKRGRDYYHDIGLFSDPANIAYFCFEVRTVTDETAKIGLFRQIVENFYPEVKIAYCACNSEDGYEVNALFDLILRLFVAT